jgi:hypothetical protein
MAQPDTAPEVSFDPVHGPEANMPPRSDLKDGIGWIALGIVILVASLRMDRLERQNINPYTVPGLLPALLGIAMILLGAVLALRSWRRGALTRPLSAPTADEREQRKRVWIVIGLCMLYGVVLIGHGLPFWAASALFVTGSMVLLQWLSQDPEERRLTPKAGVKATVIGLATGIITHVVFQELFLVRLP